MSGHQNWTRSQSRKDWHDQLKKLSRKDQHDWLIKLNGKDKHDWLNKLQPSYADLTEGTVSHTLAESKSARKAYVQALPKMTIPAIIWISI